MNWKPDKKRPICPQLCEHLCVLIAAGKIGAGEKLMSVRELAVSAGVTPNTVQKSFEQLEQKGIIHSIRGSGWYVNEDTQLAAEIMRKLVADKTTSYLNDMYGLGLTKESIIEMIKEYQNE